MLNDRQAFLGRSWVVLTSTATGQIFPEPSNPIRDVLRVKSAFNIGPNTYNVLNLSKGYSCLVQFKYGTAGYLGRCDHENCIWQSRVEHPHPCKHERAALPYHFRLIRRAPWLWAAMISN